MSRDVSVDLPAVIAAQRVTRETSEALLQNQQFMVSTIEPLLAEWQDVHVQKYLETSREISECIALVFNNLAKMEEFCAKEIAWIARYESV